MQPACSPQPREGSDISPDGARRRITVGLGRFGDLIGRGLTQIMEEDRFIDIVARDLYGASLEMAAARQAPQVVVLDEDTVSRLVLQHLTVIAPETGVIVVAYEPLRARRMQFVAAGATCVPTGVLVADLLALVRLVAEGDRAALPLTPREQEVFACLGDCQTHREIACALDISLETARSHTASIRRKLGARSNRELYLHLDPAVRRNRRPAAL